MPMLHLHLREGFNGDTVVVRAGGRELLRREGVTTDYSVGLAAAERLELPDGTHGVEVEVPTRGVRQPAPVPADGEVLACALSPAGALHCDPLAGPALYL